MDDVLVVDDDPAIREFVHFALDAEGIAARTAEHGQGALVQVQEQRPSVILLDMDMPVMDGPSFCAALDRTVGRGGMVVVVMTASPRAAQFREICHADDLLGKPFNLDDLYAVIARHLTPS